MAAQRMVDALNRSSFWLMNELDYPLISESLIEENVISRNEAETMDAIKMRREQNKQFVDLLKNKNPNASASSAIAESETSQIERRSPKSRKEEIKMMHMSHEHKEVLTDRRDYLVNSISLHAMWSHLRECRIVTQVDEELIKHGHTRVQTIEALLDHLVKRPDADFNQFCSCLRKTNQGHIAEYLENSDPNASVSSAIAKSETSPTKVKLDESGRRSPKSRREQIKGPRATLERGDAAQLTTGNPDHATSVGPEAAAPVPAPRTKKWRKTAAPQSVTMRMTDEHKAVLTDKRDYLVETISPDNLWTLLRTCRIVTESDEERIKVARSIEIYMLSDLRDGSSLYILPYMDAYIENESEDELEYGCTDHLGIEPYKFEPNVSDNEGGRRQGSESACEQSWNGEGGGTQCQRRQRITILLYEKEKSCLK
ncbi:hypothetical protein CAPTEDRAFT_191260 [Capitella teleta]|uniref:CARD domain-containing protein n=1 Tax=Capitella teleta TaxID=283909 RepID=R7TLF5_CAPTE|nr:hypothetical protein CAPTEDRAFT_191260 [Capitella teleta]|eukprot:ELT92376.1 hypothetical protein CAPTEDRAFT_191260 [Capitella teleta]